MVASGGMVATGGGGIGGGAPLPNDAAVFGQKVIAMYIFRAPYVTTTGDPPVITSLANANDRGTHDVIFEAGHRPRWIEDCGRDDQGAAYGCGRFDATQQHYGIADGFNIVTGDRPSLIAVLKMNALDNSVSIPFQLANAAISEFMNLPEVRSTQGIWRYNGSFTDTPHNTDFGTPDLALHLHEQHLMSPARLSIFDGVTQAEGQQTGDSAITGPITQVVFGRRFQHEHASVDVFEALAVDLPTPEEATHYRDLRVRLEYPTITLP